MDRLIHFTWRIIVLLLLLRVVLSWRRGRFNDPVGRWVYILTEPLLQPCRWLWDTRKYGFDASPVVAGFLVWLIRNILMALL